MGKRSILSGSGGQILVESLAVHGVDHVFCVPGESHLPVLDALHDLRDRIKLLVCRHEGGAANMAEAYGKLTGRPGIALVSRGPGATHAAIGVHTAFQDSTPMILLVGQVRREFIEREALQEVDYRRLFAPLAKWVTQIEDARRIPEHLSRAFHTAVSGRSGPVVLALPEDMLADRVEAPGAPAFTRAAAAPPADRLARLQELLGEARRPVVLLGGSGWTAEACAHFQQFAEAWRLPVACAFRHQDLFDNGHDCYAGDISLSVNPKLAARIAGADLALVLGARLGEVTTRGYTLFEVPVPKQTLVHAHAGAEELGRVYAPDLAIQSSMPELVVALAKLKPASAPPWGEETTAARADYLSWNTPTRLPGALQLGQIVLQLRERLPADAIVANGAGNFAIWVNRYYRYRQFRSQLGPHSGAMGYAVPAAVAAKSVHPERTVVAFAGDGDFLMTGQELATAVQYGLPVIVFVINNGQYGTIRMHQERNYPGRVYGTRLLNPDFAAYARSFGAFGEVVETTEQFLPAFDRALAAKAPALIELRLPEEVITPDTTLTAIREAAFKKLRVK